MDMWMMLQVLAPGMEHGDETDLGAEMARIGGDREQRLGRRLEQDSVDRGLVLESDFGSGGRQCEDDVEIGYWQQFALPLGQPCSAGCTLTFRAMPVAARIVGDAYEVALGAALDVAAQPCRAACLDRAHDAAFDPAEVAGMRLAVRLAVAAEDVRHLQCGHDRRDQAGPASSSFSRSNGLAVLPIVVAATCV